jgi:hypothetical protein
MKEFEFRIIKVFLLLCIQYIICTNIICQSTLIPFVSSSNEWTIYYEKSEEPVPSYSIRQRLSRDSIWCDKTCFRKTEESKSKTLDDFVSVSFSGKIYKEENGRVYEAVDVAPGLFLVYDFNLKVGDSTRVLMGSNTISFVKCIKVDTVIYNDQIKRRKLTVACPNKKEYVWVEGIGELNFYYSYCNTEKYRGYLSCFKVNGKVVYTRDESKDCWISVDTDDVENELGRLFPNPAIDNLNIDQRYDNHKFSIYNQLGGISKQGRIEDGKVDVGDLVNGYYFIFIETEQGPKYLRFVKGN